MQNATCSYYTLSPENKNVLYLHKNNKTIYISTKKKNTTNNQKRLQTAINMVDVA